MFFCYLVNNNFIQIMNWSFYKKETENKRHRLEKLHRLSQWCDHSPRARHPGMWSQVGLRKHHYEQSQWRWWNFSWAISNPKRWCCESAALSMPANLENSAVATGLKKVSFHSNPKERQCQIMFKLHTIAFISHASKVMLKILQARLQQYMNQELPYVQTGFRANIGTRD